MKDWVVLLYILEVVFMTCAAMLGIWSFISPYEKDAREAKIVASVFLTISVIGGIVLYFNVPPGTFPGR